MELMVQLGNIISTDIKHRSNDTNSADRIELRRVGKLFVRRIAGLLVLTYRLMINLARHDNRISGDVHNTNYRNPFNQLIYPSLSRVNYLCITILSVHLILISYVVS
jgi:hypothetical protein